jgi:hypothetical protein
LLVTTTSASESTVANVSSHHASHAPTRSSRSYRSRDPAGARTYVYNAPTAAAVSPSSGSRGSSMSSVIPLSSSS